MIHQVLRNGEIPPEQVSLPAPSTMISYLDQFIRGQDRAKRDLTSAIYNHYLSQAHWEDTGVDLGPQHVLMLGPTGCGKTYMVQLIASYLRVPVVFVSATSLVEVGYKGQAVEDIIKSLLDRAGGDPKIAEKGIIFIDEIDKIRKFDNGGQRDISGEGVQNAFLTILDGRLVDRVESQSLPQPVNTRRILFICAGAFVGIEQIAQKREGTLDSDKTEVGFHAIREDSRLIATPMQTEIQTADLVGFGMIPEFVGRFATVTQLRALSSDDLRAIITDNVEASALATQKQLAKLHGIELVLTEHAVDSIARKAVDLGTGARGLRRLIGEALDGVRDRWPDLADQGVHQVVIDVSCIENGREPELIKGELSSRQDIRLRQTCFAGLPLRNSSSPGNYSNDALASGVRETQRWTRVEIERELQRVKMAHLDWASASNEVKSWWEGFERENEHQPSLVLRVADELKVRKATISQFFHLAYNRSKTTNIQANLYYLDYMLLKKEHAMRNQGTDSKV